MLANRLALVLAMAVWSALVAGSLSSAAAVQKPSSQVEMMQEALNDLLAELGTIKNEASLRLSNARQNRIAGDERIRQTKVSKFILDKVAQLEQESGELKEELVYLFSKGTASSASRRSRMAAAYKYSPSDELSSSPSSSKLDTKIGFDLEALKKLGEEIGKRLDQFGKDTAKNLGDLVEGVKQVFKDPQSSVGQKPDTNETTSTTSTSTSTSTTAAENLDGAYSFHYSGGQMLPENQIQLIGSNYLKAANNNINAATNHLITATNLITLPSRFVSPHPASLFIPSRPIVNDAQTELKLILKLGDELESQLESRQDPTTATTESIRGVHDSSVVLVDRLVQNYLSNLRRAINRITRFIDHRTPSSEEPASASNSRQMYKRQAGVYPTTSSGTASSSLNNNNSDSQLQLQEQWVQGVGHLRQSVLNRIQLLSKRLHEFTMQWTRMVGRQTSPLWDRIPPRGTELWRDFWDTVRKQVRRINQEFAKISQDMGRLVTGQPRSDYLMASSTGANEETGNTLSEFDDTNDLASTNKMAEGNNNEFDNINVFDDQDDDFTRSELTRNVALRQQIQQEIGVFGSIFDMMQAFVRRLRETARNMVRDVLDPQGIPNNNNNAVTPGPDIRPQIDELLQETIEAQRNINSQARPVYLPNDRERNVGR